MKTVPHGPGSPANQAQAPGERAAVRPHTPGFHVELTPVAVDARPFHAVHGVPGAAIAGPLPSHWEAEPAPPRDETES